MVQPVLFNDSNYISEGGNFTYIGNNKFIFKSAYSDTISIISENKILFEFKVKSKIWNKSVGLTKLKVNKVKENIDLINVGYKNKLFINYVNYNKHTKKYIISIVNNKTKASLIQIYDEDFKMLKEKEIENFRIITGFDNLVFGYQYHDNLTIKNIGLISY